MGNKPEEKKVENKQQSSFGFGLGSQNQQEISRPNFNFDSAAQQPVQEEVKEAPEEIKVQSPMKSVQESQKSRELDPNYLANIPAKSENEEEVKEAEPVQENDQQKLAFDPVEEEPRSPAKQSVAEEVKEQEAQQEQNFLNQPAYDKPDPELQEAQQPIADNPEETKSLEPQIAEVDKQPMSELKSFLTDPVDLEQDQELEIIGE